MVNIKTAILLDSLDNIKDVANKNIQINTINAYSYNVAKKDAVFADALLSADYLLPDGQSVVWAKRYLKGDKLTRIAGYDLFCWEMKRLNEIKGKCFFLGSSTDNLEKIKERASIEYANITIETFSPPYKSEFSEEDNNAMISRINSFAPDVLFVGMTAPKQEKWVSTHASLLNVSHTCSIGAVFDFYAGSVKRAPQWMQKNGIEWLYRLIKEPRRMWKRYIIGNSLFIYYILREKK